MCWFGWYIWLHYLNLAPFKHLPVSNSTQNGPQRYWKISRKSFNFNQIYQFIEFVFPFTLYLDVENVQKPRQKHSDENNTFDCEPVHVLIMTLLSRNNWKLCHCYKSTADPLTLKVLVVTIDAQWEGMGDVGLARYEPALLLPCPTIRGLSSAWNLSKKVVRHQGK